MKTMIMTNNNLLPIIYLTRHETDIYPWQQENLYTPFWRCYWNVTLGGCFRVGDNNLELQTDLIYIVPGYFRFSTYAKKPFEQFYIHFSPPENHFPLSCGILTSPISPQWQQRWHEWQTLKNAGEENRFRCELISEVILADALLQQPHTLMIARKVLSPLVERAIVLLRKDLANPLSNKEIANHCGIELRTFLRYFKAETGESPQQYSRRIRIEAACRYLLYSDKTIDEIAELTGFPERYYFSRVFRQLQQKAPAQFRRQQQTIEKGGNL